MAKQFTLGKNERLKSRKLIEQLFSEGKSFVIHPFKIFYLLDTSGGEKSPALQFGVGAGTKNFKKAVDRNRIKRITREAYRLQKLSLQKKVEVKRVVLNVFFIYTTRALPVYNDVYIKVNLIFDRLNKIVDEIK